MPNSDITNELFLTGEEAIFMLKKIEKLKTEYDKLSFICLSHSNNCYLEAEFQSSLYSIIITPGGSTFHHLIGKVPTKNPHRWG